MKILIAIGVLCFSMSSFARLIACDINGGLVSSTPCLSNETKCHSSGFGDNSCQAPKLTTSTGTVSKPGRQTMTAANAMKTMPVSR